MLSFKNKTNKKKISITKNIRVQTASQRNGAGVLDSSALWSSLPDGLGVALRAGLQCARGSCAADSSGNKISIYSPTWQSLFF